MLAVSCLLLLYSAYIAHAQHRAPDCWVDVWRLHLQNEAVLSADGLLLLPDPANGQLFLPSGSEMLAGCAGAGNKLLLGHRPPHANIICSSAGTLEVSGKPSKPVQAADLWCERRSTPSARWTERHCGPAGSLDVYELGFSISSSWLPVIEVCHDTDAANTLYSHHMLYGSLLKFKRRPTQRPPWSTGSETGKLYQNMNPDTAYSKANVQQTLAAALGSQEKAKALLKQSPMSRGHLAPYGDLLLNTMQHTTSFYANAAPQWQTFNSGKWEKMETVLRNHAKQRSLDLKVWTGTHGVLSLDGGSKLYLAQNNRLAVPRLFWKLVQEPRTGAAIAFVGLNNPFVTPEEEKQMPCSDICVTAGWSLRKCQRPSLEGFVICCSAPQLIAALPGAPQVNATRVLQGPGASRHAAGA